MTQSLKTPTSFWAVAIFAIVWNIFEIYFSSFQLELIEVNATAEEFEQLRSLPFWYIVIFVIAIITETLGSFMLLLQKKFAVWFFRISLITLLFIELYWLFTIQIENTSIIISTLIPIMVIGIAAFLYIYSKRAAAKGWIT